MLNLYNWAANIEKKIELDSPTVCVTLDLETDYATGKFHGSECIVKLCDFCQSAGIPLTVFVEGRMFRDYREALTFFPSNTEFELHCNDHSNIPDTPESLASGIRSFFSVFQRNPKGYRAGCYQVTVELMDELVINGFLWDASFRHGLGFHQFHGRPGSEFFKLRNGIIELPVGTLPTIHLPLTMSFLSLLGLNTMKALTKMFGLPCLLVFVMHLHDLFPSPALAEATLLRRLGHNWNYRLGFTDPFERFKAFINILKKRDYEFFTCSEIIEKLTAKTN